MNGNLVRIVPCFAAFFPLLFFLSFLRCTSIYVPSRSLPPVISFSVSHASSFPPSGSSFFLFRSSTSLFPPPLCSLIFLSLPRPILSPFFLTYRYFSASLLPSWSYCSASLSLLLFIFLHPLFLFPFFPFVFSHIQLPSNSLPYLLPPFFLSFLLHSFLFPPLSFVFIYLCLFPNPPVSAPFPIPIPSFVAAFLRLLASFLSLAVSLMRIPREQFLKTSNKDDKGMNHVAWGIQLDSFI